jgi:hypothetical protein
MENASARTLCLTGWKWKMVERRDWQQRDQSSIGLKIQQWEEEKAMAT